MRIVSPLRGAMFHFIMGALFIYFAYHSITETVLDPLTLFLSVLATLEVGIGVRLLQFYLKIKRKNKVAIATKSRPK